MSSRSVNIVTPHALTVGTPTVQASPFTGKLPPSKVAVPTKHPAPGEGSVTV